MKFPNIDELGLNIRYDMANDIRYVAADQLEAFLSKAVRVTGVVRNDKPYEISAVTFCNTDTHSGLLINYKPIPKLEPVSKEDVCKLLKSLIQKLGAGNTTKEEDELIEAITKAGIR